MQGEPELPLHAPVSSHACAECLLYACIANHDTWTCSGVGMARASHVRWPNQLPAAHRVGHDKLGRPVLYSNFILVGNRNVKTLLDHMIEVWHEQKAPNGVWLSTGYPEALAVLAMGVFADSTASKELVTCNELTNAVCACCRSRLRRRYERCQRASSSGCGSTTSSGWVLQRHAAAVICTHPSTALAHQCRCCSSTLLL